MVIQKRGLIVLFSLLFILLFSSFSFAANYEGLQLKKNNDDSTYTTYDAATGDGYGPKGWGWHSGNYCEGTPKGYDYTLPSFPPSTSGCYIGAVDYDPVLDDDCLYAYAKPGYIIYSHKYTKLDASGSTGFGGDGAEDAANFLNWGWLINPGGICADDHYWHPCGSLEVDTFIDIILDSSKPKEKTRFYCLKMNDKETYLWMKAGEFDKTVDADEDGVPKFFDCNDNDDKIYPSFPKDCVEPNDKGEVPKGKVKCIVKAADEISGNTIDENCDGKLVTDADDDKDSCEKSDLNAAGVSYYWMPDAKKSEQCCGDDVDDFGKIFETNSGPRLCLKKDAKSVGSIGKVEEIAGKTSCNGDWCAPLASSDNVDFHIFTLKQPGKEAYDIVSNGDTWQKCNSENQQSTLTKPIGDKAKVANGFSCYKEGDRWSWAEIN